MCFIDRVGGGAGVGGRSQVETEARDYQASLESEVEEERRQAEHQLRLLARSNEADIQEVDCS